MNRNRQPGEPSRYTFEGKFLGWILMKEEGVHVLELGIEFDGQAHLFVDQWISQPYSESPERTDSRVQRSSLG
jgi:hypothetical protein